MDFSDVRSQAHVKRALEVAVAGGHNVLMIGPPGAGKTMLAERVKTIMPDGHEGPILWDDDGLPTAGEFPDGSAPWFGGGGLPDGSASWFGIVTRLPCPCGFLGHTAIECVCTVRKIREHRLLLSPRAADRIDIHVEVPAVRYREMAGRRDGEASEAIRARVVRARKTQEKRLGAGRTNARMTDAERETFCEVNSECHRIMEAMFDRFGLSARAYTHVLKVARTIADLDGIEAIRPPHLSEAIQYRCLDRSGQ